MSNKNLVHLLYMPFSGLGLHNGFRGNTWLKNRIRIFKQFVLPSLLNQSKKEFILWVSWRPEEESNPIVQDFYKFLNQIRGMTIVFTYGGLCFWDDKYEDKEASKRLMKSLKLSLPELKSYVGDADYVYMTCQPSDDMYLYNAIETIQKHPFDYKAIGWEKGYIMNYATKQVAEYNPDTLPPFATIRFPASVFLDPQQHYEYTGPYKSHEYVKEVMDFEPLEGRGFVVGTHGENISTTFNHPYAGKVLSDTERDLILIGTGNYFSDPVVIKKGFKLILRQILNILPFEEKIRSMYRKLPNKCQIF